MKKVNIEGIEYHVPNEVADYIDWLEAYSKHKEESLRAVVLANESFIGQSQKLLQRLDQDTYSIQNGGPHVATQSASSPVK